MVDGKVGHLGPQTLPFKNLKSTHGTFFASGNHEYYWGFDQWMKHFKDVLGFIILENQGVTLNHKDLKVLIGGVPDQGVAKRQGFPSSPKMCLEQSQDADYKILLAHRPGSCFKAKKAGFNLQLSGHTHAGQYFPASLFVGFANPYVKGLNDHQGMHVYVNRATGYWGPPIRNRAGEITLIKFRVIT